MTITIRNAANRDITAIKKILSQYILETELVEKHIDQFIVAENTRTIVGCACLDTNSDKVELRSIAVNPQWKHQGIGRRMFEILKIRAEAMTDRLYVRTAAREFFEKIGFKALDNSQKAVIWQDCAQCDQFNICLQIPMVFELSSGMGN